MVASSRRETRRARVAVATVEYEARKQAKLDAQARLFSEKHGLGQCHASWGSYKFLLRVFFGWFALVFLAIGGISALAGVHGHRHLPTGDLVAVAVSVVMVSVPPRLNRTRVFLFEEGVARLGSVRPRRIIVRWTDLDELKLHMMSGDDEESVVTCTLHAGSGTTLTLGLKDANCDRAAIAAAAERVLTARLAGPLIERLDMGLPVTIGCLTVDWRGLTSHGDPGMGGQWHVTWEQVRRLDVRLHGQRVLASVGRRDYHQARLDGMPNSFLARPVLEHAAGRAGVPMGTAHREQVDDRDSS
jgi:hypothetical protein